MASRIIDQLMKSLGQISVEINSSSEKIDVVVSTFMRSLNGLMPCHLALIHIYYSKLFD